MNDLSIFDSLFNDVLGGDVAPVLYRTAYSHSPRVNVSEDDDAYVLEMELPGRTENDVNIELNHDNLTISSKVEDKKETKEDKDEKKRKYLIRECHQTSFSRSFSLPTDVDGEAITANFKNGVLSINMKKKAIATPKKITISAS